MLDPNRWVEVAEHAIVLGMLALTIFGMTRGKPVKEPVTVIVNNYITKG